ncbi:riboflavin synthase [Ferviditalea candida]|uniref:Riboflavin synthase n=1 Tax=Ferviditalea candida TaxID=3108399 RepID=A0ABU5ZJS9_9BACL|nr:riboflavin synthase [Paenibacillaceae bacterium T2]
MFTGIIEEIGRLKSMDKKGQTLVLTIGADKVLEDIAAGDSIAVNGVCLTAVSYDRNSFTVDVMPETYRQTNLRDLSPGSPLNLERAMGANGRFGGHIVQGHVDTTGAILERRPEENAVVFTIRPSDPGIMKFVIPRGSICIDGISLTVVDVRNGTFSVSIIPHTLSETVLQYKHKEAAVNIECDLVGKYIDHLLHYRQEESGKGGRAPITESFLAEHGFI